MDLDLSVKVLALEQQAPAKAPTGPDGPAADVHAKRSDAEAQVIRSLFTGQVHGVPPLKIGGPALLHRPSAPLVLLLHSPNNLGS